MKKALISIILIINALNLVAQEKHSFISLSAGTSVPVGKLQSKTLPDGGFAQPGFTVSMEGAWFFKPWLGIGGSGGMNLHPVDVVSLEVEKLHNDPSLNSLIIRSEPYFSMGLYGGLFFNVPVREKISFTGKALGGVFYAQTPYQLYKADYFMIGKNWYDITSAGDYEGSFLVGAGLQYDLNDYVGFCLNGEFTYNQCEFDFLKLDGSTRTENKTFTFVNVGLGVVFRIK